MLECASPFCAARAPRLDAAAPVRLTIRSRPARPAAPMTGSIAQSGAFRLQRFTVPLISLATTSIGLPFGLS